jgi:hypothetical protein
MRIRQQRQVGIVDVNISFFGVPWTYAGLLVWNSHYGKNRRCRPHFLCRASPHGKAVFAV